MNNDFSSFFSQRNGTLHEFSCGQTPQQNRVAEQKNQYILEIERVLLFRAHVPSQKWDDSVATTIYLLNCMPFKSLEFKTLLQVLSQHVTLLSILLIPLCVFDCVAFFHLHKNQ